MNRLLLAALCSSAATPLAAQSVPVPPTRELIDGNGVDLDRTMAGMAENAIQYGASARAAGKKLAILRYVAGDGGG